ncbi:hypothetical protein [Massilia sp. TWP1-3-3]|uniref:hypothetical protein n=1 Tax=Massilia sp. TWP1-3-3 TaxID=2804573 RepID=UPI003CE86358
MNNFFHNLAPVLDRLARRFKIAFFLLILAVVLCSMCLHLSGVIDADKVLVEAAGPSLMVVAVTAVTAELAAAMLRAHLK